MHDTLLIHMRERFNDVTHILLPMRRIRMSSTFFIFHFFFVYHCFMTLRSEDSMINRLFDLNCFMALATGVLLVCFIG